MITAVGKFVLVSKMCFLHQVTLIVLTVISFSLTINGGEFNAFLVYIYYVKDVEI